MAALLGCPCSFTTTSTSGRLPIKTCFSRSRPHLPIIRELIHRRSTRQNLPRCSLKANAAAVDTQSSPATIPPIEYEVSYKQDEASAAKDGGGVGKGWIDAEGNLDQRMIAKLRGLAVIAGDRDEMHKVLATQRHNWNNLTHNTITILAVTAATAAALNGAEAALGLTLIATVLNLVCAGAMRVVNQQQPSQLAEEQRRAARFFRRLAVEVESTLLIDPRLREEASVYWEAKVGTLHALDGAFPLPLVPGLPKFPHKVVPSELSGPDDNGQVRSHPTVNIRTSGWTEKTEEYLRATMERINTRDVPALIALAEKAKRLNLFVGKMSPFLAAAAAVCNIVHAVSSLDISWLAAALTVGAFFAHSVSHALQLGSGFELYRTNAGYVQDIEKAVEEALQLPENMREDWFLFVERINLQLGHDPWKQTVKQNDHKAGKLF